MSRKKSVDGGESPSGIPWDTPIQGRSELGPDTQPWEKRGNAGLTPQWEPRVRTALGAQQEKSMHRDDEAEIKT